MTISITELSSYIGVTQATIERWVRQGKIPASRSKDNYRFRIQEVEKWAAKQNIRLKYPVNPKTKPVQSPCVKLSSAVNNGGIYYNVQGKDKNGILEAGIEKIENIPVDFKQDLLERILDREKALSTGIGNGIAIPHPRDPLGYLSDSMVTFCFLNTPVDFHALDNQPVYMLIFLFSTSLKVHLPLLSSLSRCLKSPGFSEFLKSGPSLKKLVKEIEILEA